MSVKTSDHLLGAGNRERISRQEFHARIRAQGVTRREDVAFVCVNCGTVQSGRSLIEAGAGRTFDEVERYLGFSCVGRFRPDVGCDWTLGGLLLIHELEVILEDGTPRPTFHLATPEQAIELAAAPSSLRATSEKRNRKIAFPGSDKKDSVK